MGYGPVAMPRYFFVVTYADHQIGDPDPTLLPADTAAIEYAHRIMNDLRDGAMAPNLLLGARRVPAVIWKRIIRAACGLFTDQREAPATQAHPWSDRDGGPPASGAGRGWVGGSGPRSSSGRRSYRRPAGSARSWRRFLCTARTCPDNAPAGRSFPLSARSVPPARAVCNRAERNHRAPGALPDPPAAELK